MQETTTELRPGSLGKLYEVLEDALPNHKGRDRHLSVTKLANGLGYSPQYLYRWFENDKLPTKAVKPLLELAKGSLDLDVLAPFILK